jgi:hypothetical protein
MPTPTFLFWFLPFAFTWGIGAMLLIPYFLPTIIALIRRSNSTAGIFVLNFFLGWTFIGWIAALVWSITSRNDSTTIIVNNTYPANSGPSYGPPPTYNPPPYQTEPSRPPYNTEPSRPANPTHQTSPTIRRTPSTQPGDAQDRGDRQA